MIFCFSGTGNSLWAAEELARLTADEVCMMADTDEASLRKTFLEAKAVGFVFPVYGWTLPAVVRDFIKRLPTADNGEQPYVYALLTCGDDIGRTDRVLAESLTGKGWKLSASFSVSMRETYICLPGFDTDTPERETGKREAAKEKIAARIAPCVNSRKASTPADVHPGSFPWFKTYVIGPLFHRFLTSPRKFRADSSLCTGCTRCSKICPLGNISAEKGAAPLWGTHCTFCMACYHACPRHAVTHGPFTRSKGQVHIERNRI